ncbi:DMP19 family protein [Sporosarcina aquimarina]|uniref:DNA mimic protein DMP19 C-terminal domain-containing protein n=1 Tax=Sporosarcina aquimarina TaxID=114975 RepID=A0ABU4G466_9BACL|nr:hypothetical protein [Sporosarcina aquimarina]MDW0111145.1 hypothetical protein [Sporosarcina aquimarina]
MSHRKREDSMNPDELWNAVVSIINECDFPTNDPVLNEAYIVFHYYSELESGGHESLFTWFGSYIEEVGIECYLNELIAILEKMDAHDYALIEKAYGEELWNMHIALENGEDREDEFYHFVEKADEAYHGLNQTIDTLLETYLVSHYKDFLARTEV